MNPESSFSRIALLFWKNPPARWAFRVLLVLFALAALAPFLANNHALVRSAEGKISLPVLASLEPIQWRFFLYALAALGAWIFRRTLSARSWRWPAILFATIFVVEIAVQLIPSINDPSNDRTRPADWKLLAPIPYSPYESSAETFAAPSPAHWCGTDSIGRDIASRLVHGARTSLSIGFVAQGIALLIGVTLGALAGYYRGVLDMVLMRFVEIMECFPALLLILVVVGLFESRNNMFAIMAVIGATSWTGLARLVRAEFLRLGGQPFVSAAQALGASDARVILLHLLPNALGPILVTATFGVASAILIESSLSFLGFGMQAPTPSWGDILGESEKYIDFAWWLAFFPGIAILVTIMSYNFVGEGLRDAVDPRLQTNRK